MEKIMQIGIIGCGARGEGILKGVLLDQEGFSVVALCDVYSDRTQKLSDLITAAEKPAPVQYTDYRKLIAHKGLDAVYIATSWQTHSHVACCALEAGVAVACEVGGAFTQKECWRLVETQRKTGTPLMPMENCCFGRTELMLCQMLRNDVFGDITHVTGAYAHDLRSEIANGRDNRHYRIDNYLHRNCENYPTHELGPLGMLLGLGKGNRMVSLVSVASRSAGLNAYISQNRPNDAELANAKFAQGDVVTTIITCAGGETITLVLDTTLPRYYSRGLSLHGTKAMFNEENMSLFVDKEHNEFDFDWKSHWGNFDQYRDEYEHPMWKEFLQEGIKGGHDGMDWLTFKAFLNAWRKGEEFPITVQDMVSWMMVSLLSEQSIAAGGAPQYFPDFTNGGWMTEKFNITI